jgi:undecaprenyl-phosphate galactose phosphotransferase
MDRPVQAYTADSGLGDAGLVDAPKISAPVATSFLLAKKSPEDAASLPDTVSIRRSPDARAFDIVVATVLLLFVAPLLAACAVAVALSGPGPLLFRQTRIGRDGREFTCLKFRTMIPDAHLVIDSILQMDAAAREQWEAVQKLRSDPRVTLVGRHMRRFCLDELPQLFNVLAGQMSVVGPRPIVAAEVERYGPYFADYCLVRPGLTGPWQISGRHSLSYDQRVRLDSQYARSKSVKRDLAILWKTVPVVLFGLNA